MKLDRFINRPVLSTVISILIVILGILGLVSLPITQYPDIAPPTVRVSATYTGANAQTVLNSVIAPLEEQINGVENMMYMTSTASNNGEASIEVYFTAGRPDQRCGEHDVHDFQCHQQWFRRYFRLLQTGNQPGYGCRKRTKPRY